MLLALATAGAHAEDVEKKFRVSFSVGSYDTQDNVPSDAANVAVLVDPSGGVVAAFEDPRLDTASTGSLTIKPAMRYSFAAQYAFTKTFILEASAGYQKGDVGEVEVQAMFAGDIFDTQRESFNFRSLRTPGGEMTQVPLQLTGAVPIPTAGDLQSVRRSRHRLHLRRIRSERRARRALGEHGRNDRAVLGARSPFPGGFGSSRFPLRSALEGATVDAPDTFEWHAAAGAEWTFKKKWSAFFDARYMFASKVFRLGFNGEESLGVSVPSGEFDLGSPESFTRYGTYFIAPGLVDAGCLVPASATTTVPCPPADNLGCDPAGAFGAPTARASSR